MQNRKGGTEWARSQARQMVGEGGDAAASLVKSVCEELGRVADDDVEAANLLGAVHLEVTQNYQKARHWFTLSAGKGDAVGLRSFGYMYAAGLGMRANAAEAMKLFERSADAGDAYAKYNLALENIGARGRYFDAERTVLLLEESYRAGVVEAAAELGDFMAGSDLLEEACDWYLLAAQGGHAGAMKVLGCWYRDGELGQADNVQAIRWFLRRALAGKADGIHEALQVAKRVGPDDVREAARQADARTYGQSIISTLWS